MAHYFFTLILLSLNIGDTLAHLPLPKVTTPDTSQPPLSAPPPTSGGELSSSPSHGWGLVSGTPAPAPAPDSTFPLVPREGSSRNSPSPTGSPAGGDGIPFISSNPAVPLPTGMTFRPLPTPGDGTQVVGIGSKVRIQRCLVVFSTMFSTAAALVLWML